MLDFSNGQEKGEFRDKLNTPPLHGIGGSFKRAQSGDNRYGIANCPQLDDGHTVVLMVIGSPLALSDAHLKVTYCWMLDHAHTATARRPYIGTCLAKNP
jgi:hypothetical protein